MNSNIFRALIVGLLIGLTVACPVQIGHTHFYGGDQNYNKQLAKDSQPKPGSDRITLGEDEITQKTREQEPFSADFYQQTNIKTTSQRPKNWRRSEPAQHAQPFGVRLKGSSRKELSTSEKLKKLRTRINARELKTIEQATSDRKKNDLIDYLYQRYFGTSAMSANPSTPQVKNQKTKSQQRKVAFQRQTKTEEYAPLEPISAVNHHGQTALKQVEPTMTQAENQQSLNPEQCVEPTEQVREQQPAVQPSRSSLGIVPGHRTPENITMTEILNQRGVTPFVPVLDPEDQENDTTSFAPIDSDEDYF